MVKVTLDAEAFKVLASDTRLQILKSLDDRPKTVSELGRELNLNKATVHEHLQQLILGDLVSKKGREGRKWVYYTLSWKGKSLLHPENTTVLVLLSLALLGSGGAVTQLGYWMRWWGNKALSDAAGDGGEGQDMSPFGFEESAPAADDSGGQSASEPSSGEPSSEPSGASEPSSPPPSPEDQSGDALKVQPDGPEADTTGSGDGFFDFLTEGDFWIFAVLALIGTAALIAAAVVKEKARRLGRKTEIKAPGPQRVA